MTISQAILGFAAVALVLTVIPGLDTTLVLRSALISGNRVATATALGIGVGSLVWGVSAAVGAAALLAASETAYTVVKLAGAIYMAFLGVSMVVASFRAESPALPTTTTRQHTSPWWGFLTGAWTNLLNPKIGVFYIATIPQFIPAGTSHAGMGLLLAGTHVLLSLTWFVGIIAGANAARRWLANARAMRIIDRLAGTILIGFAAKLALQRSS